MVKFYLVSTLFRISEWIAKIAIEIAGGQGYIDIQFEIPLNKEDSNE